MGTIRRAMTASICLLPVAFLKPPLLRLIGHRVSSRARIAPSLVLADRLCLDANARIGPLNFISVRRLVMREDARIGYCNVIKARRAGRFSLLMRSRSFLGSRNAVLMGHLPHGHAPVQMRLGTSSVVTAGHYINVEESILIGADTVVAGIGTQLWTHGFVHLQDRRVRAEVRGKIIIGENVYIGSSSCIAPGIRVADDVAIGAHSSVAKSLLTPGVYVSQGLRHIPQTGEERLQRLTPMTDWAAGSGAFYWREPEPPIATQR
jgi:acetyltransferase-like isoleucine patch superfamily enzyme